MSPQRPSNRAVIPLSQAIVIIAAIFVLMLQVAGWQDCTDRGGQYVRSMVWFTCVDPDQP